MKKILLTIWMMLTLTLGGLGGSVFAATCNDQADGDWNQTATWDCGIIPDSNDDVTIDSHTVTLTASASVNNLSLGAGGTLASANYDITVAGSWVNTGGTFTAGTETVTFNATSGTHTVAGGSSAFNNVVFDDGAGDATWEITADLTADGNVTLTSGTVDHAGARDITVSGDLDLSGGTYGYSAWSYRKKITVDAAQIDSDLTDYPVYVDLSTLGSDFFASAQTDTCHDIRVTKADGVTELPREVVACDSKAETGELHFKATGTLSASSDTEFFIYYGNGAASDYATNATYGAENVWDSNFVFVSHDGGGTDSTSNGKVGTRYGGISLGGNSGKLGQATDFNGTSQYIDVPNGGDFDWGNGVSYTFSVWVKTSGGTGSSQALMDTRNGSNAGHGLGFRILESGLLSGYINDNSGVTAGWNSIGTYDDGAWNLLAITYNDGESGKTYANGSLDDDDVISEIGDKSSGSTVVTIGNHNSSMTSAWSYYDGLLDEYRVSKVERIWQWLKAEYVNQSSPGTFYSVGSEEDAANPKVILSGTGARTYTTGNHAVADLEVASGDWTAVGNVDADGSFTVSGGTFTQGANNLSVGGDFTLANGVTFTKATGGGTVLFDGDQIFTDNTSPQQDIGDVTIGASPDTTDLATDFTATSLIITAGDFLNTNGYDLDIGTGGITVNGTLDATDDVEGDTTMINTQGGLTITGAGVFTSDNSTVTFDGSSATVDLVTDSTGADDLYNFIINGSSLMVEIEDDLIVSGDLTITAGTLDTKTGENNAISVGGDWTNAGTFIAQSGTVTFDGTGAQALTSGGSVFYHMTVNGTGNTVTLADALMLGGNLTITSGELDTADFDVTVGGSVTNDDTLTAGASMITVGGSWDNDAIATFTAGTSVVNFSSGDTDETITINGDAFNDLAITGPTIDLTSGLVGHWSFNSADVDWSDTGSEIKDLSGNGNHGDASTSGMDSSNTVIGARGQGLYFDGNTNHLNLGSASIYDDQFPYSYVVWVKVPDLLSEKLIFSKGDGSNAINQISITTDGQILRFLRYSGANFIRFGALNDISVGQWHHVVVAHSGDAMDPTDCHIYVDGIETAYTTSGTPTGTQHSDASNNLWIAGFEKTLSYSQISLDDVRIYNRALSPAEVTQLYASGKYRLQDTLDVNGDLTLSSGELDADSNDITLEGSWLNDGGAFTSGTGTVTMDAGSGTVNLKSGGTSDDQDFYDLIIDDGGGGATVVLGSALDVDHNLTIAGGTLDASVDDYAITLAGDWSNADTFTAQNGTVTLDGADQAISGATTFYNLTKNENTNDSVDVTLTMPASETITIIGALDLTGLDVDDRLNIISSTPGVRSAFSVSSGQTVHWLDVSDSEVFGTADIRAYKSLDTSNNDTDETSPLPHWVIKQRNRRIF